MKRSILAFVVAAMVSIGVFAQGAPVGKQSYAGTVELGTTITDLARLASSGSPAELASRLKGKAFLLVGTLGKPVIAETETFSATAPFQEGVWSGTSSVSIVRVYLRFTGDEFADFAERERGIRAVALLDSGELAPAPDGGMAIYFRVVSIRAVE